MLYALAVLAVFLVSVAVHERLFPAGYWARRSGSFIGAVAVGLVLAALAGSLVG